MPELPSLTEQQIRDWTAPRFFERGQGYFKQGRVRNPRREGATIKAACEGSMPNPYRVEATLGAAGIASARCSCPMGDGGYCKHVVALLLTWLRDPDAFAETESLDARLEHRPKADLIALISAMVDRHPDLETLVALPSARSGDEPWEAVDEEFIHEQARQALLHAGGDWQSGYRATQDLDRILALGDDYAEQDDAQNAITIYQALAETVQEHYHEVYDHEGDVAHVLYTCSEKLGALLPEIDNEAERRAVFETLFAIYRWDVDQGGYGISDAVPDLLLEQTTPEERQRAARWTRDALQSTASSWAREAYGRLLIDLEADRLSDEEFLDICRTTDLTVDLIWKLLEQDRPDDALQAARHADSWDLLQAADLFIEHDQGEAIYQLMLERAQDSRNAQLVTWLREHASVCGDSEAVLAPSKELFWTRPSVDAYAYVREIADATGRWDPVRAELIERLQQEQRYGLLTRIYLDEQKVDDALRTVHRLDEDPHRRWAGSSLQLNVAEAAEDDHPHRAADIYLERACDLIEQRGRKNYRAAADFLKRIRDTYQRAGDLSAWPPVIEAIREENQNLPALQDELDKAGL